MKLKDRKELHAKSIKELGKQVMDAKDALAELILEKVQNKLKNTSLIFVKRKEISQMLTIMRMKQLLDKVKEKKS